MKLATEYLGLKLKHPIIAGACPLADDLDTVRNLEDAGASAIVMRSLFEEQILMEERASLHHVAMHQESFGEALSYLPGADEFEFAPNQYLEHLQAVKKAVAVPVIASLNGVTTGGWVGHAKLMQEAGADALELNFYHIPTSPDENAATVEARVVEILKAIKASITIPVAVKLHPFFSSLPHFAKALVGAGADGLVLFNRFYQPDIDVEELEVKPSLQLSTQEELRLRLRWLAILSASIKTDYSATGGVHCGLDAVKAVMTGAHTVQLVSCLLQKGPAFLGSVVKEFEQWITEHEYESLGQMRGSMNLGSTPDPAAFERASYMRVLQGWKV